MKNNVTIMDLILIGIYSLQLKNETATWENLVAECFTKYPKVFGFKRYPQWPDSQRFDRPLRTLRNQGYINGSSNTQFTITQLGKIRIEIITKNNKISSIDTNKGPSIRSSDDKLIEHIKGSKHFLNYIRDPSNFKPTKMILIDILNVTFETPNNVLLRKIEYLLKLANEYEENDLYNFINLFKSNFKGMKNGTE